MTIETSGDDVVAQLGRRAIALVGMMGVGKSSVGRALADALGRPFVDLDARVAESARASVADIFATEGEASFRRREAAALDAALVGSDAVVACGGGAVLDADNRAALRAAADVCWLTASPATLAARLAAEPADAAGRATRPLAGDAGALAAMLRARRAAYADAADVAVDVDGVGVDAAVARVRAGLAAGAVGGVVRTGATYDSDLCVGAGALDVVLPALAALGGARVAIVSDANVWPLHAERLTRRLAAMGCAVERHTLRVGEADKTLTTFVTLVEALVAGGADRDLVVVAVGGGVVCDVAGFAAATALRGVRHALVPTTLLAMVDAALGGKTGVDTAAGKNLVGAFYPPRLIVADTHTLATLPPRERRAGLAEALKTALVADDGALLAHLERHAAELVAGEPAALATLAGGCARAKLDLVAADPHERGRRRVLNFGHTLGHALERELGYGVLLHGEAVAIGMALALDIGVALGVTPAALRARVRAAMQALALPLAPPAPTPLAPLLEALRHDKKAVGVGVRFILLAAVGATVERVLEADEVAALLPSTLPAAATTEAQTR